MGRIGVLTVLVMASAGVCATAVAEDVPRTVSVIGTGSVEATADRAFVTMSIVARNEVVTVAQSRAAAVTSKVLAVTDKLRIDRSRVDTTGASVRPDYRFNRQNNEQELRGFIASRQIRVEVRDLDHLAKVIEGAVAAGVNQVSEPQLFSSTRRENYREALDNAANDAKANAEQLARTLGMQLGPVLTINAGSGSAPVPSQFNARAMVMGAEGSADASYNVGDLNIRTTINVTFELLPN